MQGLSLFWREGSNTLGRVMYSGPNQMHMLAPRVLPPFCFLILCVLGDHHGFPPLQVWNTDSLECIATLTGHTGPVRTLVRCGDKIFSGSYDKTVKVWDANTLKCLATLVGHTGAVRALAASERVVFSGSDDTTIKVWLAISQLPRAP